MNCDKCKGNRILRVGGKVGDLCWMELNGKEHDGYVPDSRVGSGDYLEFDVCLDCGKIQGHFPVFDPF